MNMNEITDDTPLIVPVDETLEALGHGDNWIQNSWTDGEQMCLHQGIRVCQKHPGDAYLIEQVATQQGWGTLFNDRPGTTFDDVKQRLVEHREIFPHELEETFGPQWESIVGLVRQVAALTPEQASKLSVAYAAADAAAAYAANAADAAAAYAARGAAHGVACRHLISQHGFTQEHYDTLVGPWEAVMGTEWTRPGGGA